MSMTTSKGKEAPKKPQQTTEDATSTVSVNETASAMPTVEMLTELAGQNEPVLTPELAEAGIKLGASKEQFDDALLDYGQILRQRFTDADGKVDGNKLYWTMTPLPKETIEHLPPVIVKDHDQTRDAIIGNLRRGKALGAQVTTPTGELIGEVWDKIVELDSNKKVKATFGEMIETKYKAIKNDVNQLVQAVLDPYKPETKKPEKLLTELVQDQRDQWVTKSGAVKLSDEVKTLLSEAKLIGDVYAALYTLAGGELAEWHKDEGNLDLADDVKKSS